MHFNNMHDKLKLLYIIIMESFPWHKLYSVYLFVVLFFNKNILNIHLFRLFLFFKYNSLTIVGTVTGGPDMVPRGIDFVFKHVLEEMYLL